MNKPLPEGKPIHFFEAYGGRKTARARVRLYPKAGPITVNGKSHREYFSISKHRRAVEAPFNLVKLETPFSATAVVRGGGTSAQAEAVRNGLAKALVLFDPELKKKLRRAGFVTRDPRAVERKKYGLKKARRAPQWQKR